MHKKLNGGIAKYFMTLSCLLGTNDEKNVIEYFCCKIIFATEILKLY